MIPIEVLSDQNCLYNSIECLAGTATISPTELRGKYHKINIK